MRISKQILSQKILLPSAALLVGELLEVIKRNGKVRKVGKNRFRKDGQKIMLKLGEKILLS